MKELCTLFFLFAGIACQAYDFPLLPKKNVNFIVISDSGDSTDSLRSKAMILADNMDRVAAENRMDFILHAGDPIHDRGAVSGKDPEWKFKLDDVYSREHLMKLPWYGIPGNHEYRANPEAVVEFSSQRSWWKTPSRYYSFERKLGGGKRNRLQVVMLDTTPMIDSYKRRTPGKFDDAYAERELHWADSVLCSSEAVWKIVLGHHPIYAKSGKKSSEREDLQRKLLPILEKAGVKLYINGHLHNFQHIKRSESSVHFVTTASSVRMRKVKKKNGTLYMHSGPGFSVVSIGKRSAHIYFVDGNGDVLYDFKISK